MILRLLDKSLKIELIVLIMILCVNLLYGQNPQDIANKTTVQINLEEVKAQELKLHRLLDSIKLIQIRLIEILEVEEANFSVKEEAVNVLAKIKNKEVIEYLLTNEQKLRYGEFPAMDDDYDGESSRTAMLAIFREYLSPGAVNWMVFPYLLKHVSEVSYTEIGIVRALYGYEDGRFNKPIHLLRFMEANARPELKSFLAKKLSREEKFKNEK